MKQTHKKALLAAALLSAVLAGTALALLPSRTRHKDLKEQEEMLVRLETAGQEEQETEVPVPSAPDMELLVAAETLEETQKEPGEPPTPEPALELETEPETLVRETVKKPVEGAEIGILSIPKIDARLPVTAGVSEEQLKVSEGWVRQTDIIGSEGNAVIAGHRSYTFGRHFNRLEELETGDEILFTTKEGETIPFVVDEILTADPDDPAVFALPPDGEARLTLYTCTPVKIATHRLIVRALRLEK